MYMYVCIYIYIYMYNSYCGRGVKGAPCRRQPLKF